MRNASFYYDKGVDYYNEEKYRLAIDEFTTAIRLNPNYTYAYVYRGVAYDKLSQYQRAIEDYDRVIQLVPNFAMAYNNRGWAYQELGKTSSWMTRRKWSSKAQEDFDKARSLRFE